MDISTDPTRFPGFKDIFKEALDCMLELRYRVRRSGHNRMGMYAPEDTTQDLEDSDPGETITV